MIEFNATHLLQKILESTNLPLRKRNSKVILVISNGQSLGPGSIKMGNQSDYYLVQPVAK
jgi:hypothetical protein